MAFTPAKAIREKVKVKQILAAQELLSQYQDSLSPNQREELSKLVAQHYNQAKNLIFEASLLENQGKVTEAKDLLERALDIAVDYPGLQTDIERLQEAGHLARYVRKRSERIREDLPSGKNKRYKQTAGIVAGFLLVTISIALLLLARNEKLQTDQSTDEIHITRQQMEVTAPPDSTLPPERSSDVAETKVSTGPLEPASQADPMVAAEQMETAPLVEPKIAAEPETQSQGQLVEPGPRPESAEAQVVTAGQSNQQDKKVVAIGTTREQMEQAEIAPVNKTQAEKEVADETPAAPAVDFDEDFEVHVVQEGDSLSLLAYRYFCNEQERHKLYIMNSDILASPDDLVIGQRLRLATAETKIENLCDTNQ